MVKEKQIQVGRGHKGDEEAPGGLDLVAMVNTRYYFSSDLRRP